MFQHFLAVKSPLRQAELHKQICAKCEAGAGSQGGRDTGKTEGRKKDRVRGRKGREEVGEERERKERSGRNEGTEGDCQRVVSPGWTSASEF